MTALIGLSGLNRVVRLSLVACKLLAATGCREAIGRALSQIGGRFLVRQFGPEQILSCLALLLLLVMVVMAFVGLVSLIIRVIERQQQKRKLVSEEMERARLAEEAQKAAEEKRVRANLECYLCNKPLQESELATRVCGDCKVDPSIPDWAKTYYSGEHPPVTPPA